MLGSLVGFFFFTTQYLQEVLAYSPLQAGLAFLPMTVPTFVAALTVPVLTRRLGTGPVAVLAFAFLAVGLFWLSRARSDASYAIDVAAPMLLVGLGNGLGLAPLTVAGVAGIDGEDHGAASGVINVFHQLGGSVGLGILVVVFAHATSSSAAPLELVSARIGAANAGAATMSLLGLLVCVAALNHRRALEPATAD